MSKQPPRRPAGKNRPQQRKGRTAVAARGAKRQSDRTLWIAGGIVVAVGIALVIAFAGNKKTTGNVFIKGDVQASASVVSKVTGLDSKVFNAVGQGSIVGLPSKLPGPALTTSDGKPRVVYLGAEYCPYCATERWGMVQALSRFGTFTNLRFTSSAKVTQVGSPEVFPGTATFSFHNTKYVSKYFQFEAVESEDNSYKPLETPTQEQSDLAKKYDAPPYVSQQSTGSIPFIDFANQWLIDGASYDAGVLRDKSHAQIATAMADPTTDISKGAVGTANAITAAICKIDGDKPADVCGVQAVKDIEAKLK